MREFEDAFDWEVSKPGRNWNFVICVAIAAGVIWFELF